MNSLDIIPVRCNQCQKKFGVKSRAAGKEVACPHCKARQVAPQRAAQPQPTEQSDVGGKREAKTLSTHSKVPATKVVSPANDNPVSPEIAELLPPKYLVPQSLELTTAPSVSEIKTAKVKKRSGFEIDTATLRLPVGNSVAEVRTLTREKRDHRKRIRVAIVYLAGIIILVVVFWWLMSRTEVVTP